MANELRAFFVKVENFGDDANCIVMSRSPAKAKYQVYREAREAGYKVNFADLKVRRVPDWDNGGLLEGPCYSENVINTL